MALAVILVLAVRAAGEQRATAGITDPMTVVEPDPLAPPPLHAPVVDPAFGSSIRRVTDATAAGSFGTHIYSQLQAFTTDNAYLLLIDQDRYVVRRVLDLVQLPLDTSEWNAPRWQPASSHTLVHYDSNADTTLRVQQTDVDARTTAIVFTFPAPYERIRNNQSFDALSEDGRWMAGMADRADGVSVIFSLDLVDRTLGAQLALPDLYGGPCAPDPIWGPLEPDWIGVSPLGRYLVVQWPRDGIQRCSGLETFDIRSGAFVGRVSDGHQHGDLGVLPDGTSEFFMTFELYHSSGNLAIATRALPGSATVSQPTYVRVLDWIGAHISCRGPHGVCLVTTSADPANGWSALEGELFLQFTDGSVERIAHHRSTSCGYWVQPRASLSRDGRYAVFASDWQFDAASDSCQGGLGQGEAYVVDLDGGAPPNSAPSIAAGPPLAVQRGGVAAQAPLATVSDAETPAGNLVVAVAPPVPPAISVTDLVNVDGAVTATVTVDPAAGLGPHDVTVEVTDGTLSAAASARVVVYAVSGFEDDSLRPGRSVIKAVHVTELRARIDALRLQLSLTAVVWTDPVLRPGITPVRAAHMTDLRAALSEVYDAVGSAGPIFTNTISSATPTLIRAVDLTELRAAVLALEG